MPPERVVVEKKGRLAVVVLNSPEKLNALDSATLRALDEAFAAVERDGEVDVALLTGAGKAFCAGADVAELASMTPASAREFSMAGRAVFSRIERLKKPVIAAVNGYALGGGLELALACDIRIASESASFGLPEVSLGIIPGFGGTERLPRVVGQARARELIFTGARIGAAEAASIGLIARAVPAEKLMEEAEALAAAILNQSATAVQMAKSVLNGLATEAEAFAICFSLPDQRERMSAFLERQRKREQRQKER